MAKLAYTPMFLKEVLRLYPPVFTIARKTTKPIHFSRGFGEDQLCLDDTPVIYVIVFCAKHVQQCPVVDLEEDK